MDYDSGPYNITFPAGTTSVPFSVSITDDNILENNENFLLTVDLSSLPDNITAIDPYQATVTIVDKDGKLTVVAEFRYMCTDFPVNLLFPCQYLTCSNPLSFFHTASFTFHALRLCCLYLVAS